MYVCVYICTYVYIYSYIRIYVFINLYIYIYKNVCIYIHIYMQNGDGARPWLQSRLQGCRQRHWYYFFKKQRYYFFTKHFLKPPDLVGPHLSCAVQPHGGVRGFRPPSNKGVT